MVGVGDNPQAYNDVLGVSMRYIVKLIPLIAVLALCSGCNSSAIDELLDTAEVLIDEPERRTIDVNRMGVNAFVNDGRFGTISGQFSEVRDTLGLGFIRVLFNWGDDVQASPGSSPDFSFYDDILSNVPAGIDVLIVVTGIPSWMSDSANWVGGNPRLTFVELWVKPVIERYGGNSAIVGFQIWNEPNMESNPENTVLSMVGSPTNYLELLTAAYGMVKANAPSKLVVTAATTSINQNYPGSVNYNRDLRNAGAESFADIWAIHYYGRQFENVVRDDGVADFLGGVTLPIWITESGAQGVNNQLPYAEQVWPFLRSEIPGIVRIYYYKFDTESSADYGLRTLDANFPVSDLYVHLRDR